MKPDAAPPQIGSPTLEAVRAEIAALWRLLFKDSALDVTQTSDFFALGGNSLLALEMVERLYERYQIEIGILAVVEHPTLRQLAEFVKEAIDGDGDEEEGTL